MEICHSPAYRSRRLRSTQPPPSAAGKGGNEMSVLAPSSSLACVYIYRSGHGNVFKIGRAIDLEKRVKTHATGNPEPLTKFDVIETEYASQVEAYLHRRLRSKKSRRSGSQEFFVVDPSELRALILDAQRYAEE